MALMAILYTFFHPLHLHLLQCHEPRKYADDNVMSRYGAKIENCLQETNYPKPLNPKPFRGLGV